MSEPVAVYVLDTSAWLTLIEDESGADTVQDLIENADADRILLLTSFMSYMEVYYITLQEHDEAEAMLRIELMASLPVFRIESSATLGNMAAEIKANFRLSVADAWIAALAKEHDAILIHKDPEFEQVEAFLSLSQLPYKGHGAH